MITFAKIGEKYDCVTHGGTHHADDIFSMVLLDKLYGDVRILRIPYDVSDFTQDNNTLAFDTLGGEFDHHQKGGNGYHKVLNEGSRPILYASFGLLWEKFGIKYLERQGIKSDELEFVWSYIEYNLVRCVDAADNGAFPISPNRTARVPSVSFIISLLNTPDDLRPADDNQNIGLQLAILLASKVLDLVTKKAHLLYTNQSKASTTNLSELLYQHFKKILSAFSISNLYSMTYKLPEKCSDKAWDSLYGNITELCNCFLGENCEHAKQFIISFIEGLRFDSMNNNEYTLAQGYDDSHIFTMREFFGDEQLYGSTFFEDFNAIMQYVSNNLFFSVIYRSFSKAYVEEQIRLQTGSRILVLDKKAYWQDFVAKSPLAKSFWFVVSPSETGGYKVQPIPCKYNENGWKKGFPSKWYGYRSGKNPAGKIPADVVFIHALGFLAISKTREGAIALCQKSFGNTENKKLSQV